MTKGLVTTESGLGILPAIDLRKNVKLMVRTHVIAARVDGRRTGDGDVGHYEISEVGDVRGLSWWLQEGETGGDPARGKRGLSAWRYAWPVVVLGGTSGGGAIPGPITPSGAPAGDVPQDSRTPSGPITPNSSGGFTPTPQELAWLKEHGYAVPDQGGGATSDYAPPTDDRMVPLLATGVAGGRRSIRVQPVKGDPWSIDARWTEKSWSVEIAQPGATGVGPGPGGGSAKTVPDGWPCIPGNFYGVLIASTDDDAEVETLHPTDPRLVAVSGGDPAYGSVVCDINSGGLADSSRHARLHTLCRVIRAPSGGYQFLRNQENTLALELGRTGAADAEGGIWSDGGSGHQVALGLPSVRSGGPIDCVAKGCQHSRGQDADGNRLTPVHLSTESLFRGSDHRYDGPLHFEQSYPMPVDLEYPVRVHLGFDPRASYRLPRDGGTESFTGKYKWWTTAIMGVNTPGGPPPPPPGPKTPGGPTTGGGNNEDPPHGPDPNTGGPTTPGPGEGDNNRNFGDNGLNPDGSLINPGGYNPFPILPPYFGGSGGPVRRFPDDPEDPSRPYTPPPDPYPTDPNKGPPRSTSFYPTDSRVAFGASKDLRPRIHGSAVSEIALTSLALRPQLVVQGERDLRYGASASAEEIEAAERTRPVTLRVEAWGRQNNGVPVYTQQPTASRSRGGTSSGGLVVMPPEIDMSDVNESLGDGDGTRSLSQGFVVLAPGVSLAFGLPDLSTGQVKTAMTLELQTGSSDVKVRHYDAAGAITDLATLGSALVTMAEGANIATGTGTGTKIGTASTQRLGFFNASPVTQRSAIADPVGGLVVDSEARTAIVAIRDALKDLGLIAT